MTLRSQNNNQHMIAKVSSVATVHASINTLKDRMENGFGQDKGEQSGNVVAWIGEKLATLSVELRQESPGVLTLIQRAGCDFPRVTKGHPCGVA